MERTNPIIEPYHTIFEIPPFGQIKVEDIMPALLKGYEEGKTVLEKINNNPEKATFENTILPLENISPIFERANRIYRCYRRSVMTSEFLAIEKEFSNLISKFYSEILMNTKLFIRIKYLFDNKETLGLDTPQRLLVEKKYESFVREGALLSDQDKNKLKDLNAQLSNHFADFSKNLVKYRNDFTYIIDDEERLKGLPKKTILEAANEAKKRKLEGKWAFTLSDVSTVLTYAEDRDFRQQMYQAYQSQASSGEYNNIPVIKEIIKIRSEKAHLLGFENFAAYQTANVMAKTPQNAINTLMNIWEHSIKKFKKELAEIQSIANSENSKDFKIEPWDWNFYAEKVYAKKYNIDERILKQYFSLESVVKGIFLLAKRLYGISFKELENAPKYYPDIQVYEVLDENDQHLAIFNTDFFSRPIKRLGWWTSIMKVPYIDSNNVNHRPIVSVVCNLKKPLEEGDPCLLSLDDVEGIFHEFGHALHTIFCQVRYASQYSENADRDFLELPSQINEHWAFEPELLKEYAHHYKTGEPISDDIIEKLKFLPHHNAGYNNITIISTSYLDMKYGMIPSKDIDKIDILQFEEKIRNELSNMPHEIDFRFKGPFFRHAFECDDYSCGYYTYKWAEILDKFAFELFKEKGVFDKETALSFRKNILEMGASEDPMKLFVKFRGCEPKIDAFLKYYGFTD